ncbi:hypothetical protein EYF80_040585 [Liparis tanakae]|uniref:Uncharacterized protein n=1 Tax=Liparis tanakae TaxID=230148 RepID=A0A4Z2G6R8_9TELE|nr:hypothetical protein EYF80_040585 [Liparis tanakae]
MYGTVVWKISLNVRGFIMVKTPAKCSRTSFSSFMRTVMPQVMVFTPHTRVFTRLRQSDTWNVCLSSFSLARSKDAAVEGGAGAEMGVGGAGG